MPIPLKGGFTDVEESSFDAIPSGTYDAVIYDSEVKEAGDTAKYPGNQYISWEFNITDGDYEKRKLWYNTSLATSPEAVKNRKKVLSMLLGFLKAAGVKEEELQSGDFELDPEDLYGTPVKLVVVQREYPPGSKQYTNDVKRVLPATADASAGSDDLP